MPITTDITISSTVTIFSLLALIMLIIFVSIGDQNCFCFILLLGCCCLHKETKSSKAREY